MFGYYRAKLLIQLRTSVKDNNVDYSYKDNPIINTGVATPNEADVAPEVIQFWGKGYETDEYRWFEGELDSWKMSHKCDTKAEETLLKEIVFKQFEIEKARQEEGNTATLVKELQDLMKTASVDPSKANTMGQGRNDTFSSFIKLIESDEPAEVFGDERDAFVDFAGIDKYFQNYVVRPLKNFVLQSRDFNIEDGLQDDDDDTFEKIEALLPDTIPEISIKDMEQIPEGNHDNEGN